MGPLEKFDPTPAVRYWMTKKNRHQNTNNKSHQQEWFQGVFNEAEHIKKTNKPLIQF